MPLPFAIPFALPALALAKSWWKAAVGAAVVAGPIFLVGQCSGAGNERHRTEAAQAVAVAAAVTKNAGLLEKSGSERLADRGQVQQQTERLTNAVAAVADDTPDPVAIALGCQRLRADRQDVSKLPQCSGPQAGGKAAPHP